MAQFKHFLCISLGYRILGIPLGVEQLRRTLNSGSLLPDKIHLTFPTTTEQLNDFIFIGQHSARSKVEASIWLNHLDI